MLIWIRYAVHCMMWTSLFLLLALLVLGGLGLIYLYIKYNAMASLVFGVILIIIAVIIGIVLYCAKDTINFLCSILAVAAKFVKQHCSVTLLPIVSGFFVLIVIGVWIFVLIKSKFLGPVVRRTVVG